MKIITFEKIKNHNNLSGDSLVIDGVRIGQKPFVYPDGAANYFLNSRFGKHIKQVRDLAPYLNFYSGQSLHEKILIIWRTGGFGDILFITPLVRHLKKKYPTARIWFGTRKQYLMIMRGNLDLERVYPTPIPLNAIQKADYHLHFEGTIEKSKNPDLHAVDLFAAHAGIILGEREKLPIYHLSKSRVALQRQILIEMGVDPNKPWVAVQIRASSVLRTYPTDKIVKLMKKINQKGFEVLALGLKGDFPKGANRKGIFDLTGRFPDMTDTVAVMSLADVLVAPDSSLTHFAAAIGLPSVGLYGPFPGKVRTLYYPKCITLDSHLPCSPCFTHGRKPCHMAQKEKEKFSPCLCAISPKTIIDAVLALIEKYGVKNKMTVPKGLKGQIRSKGIFEKLLTG